MDPIASLHPTPKGWLVSSVLAPFVGAFTAQLKAGRYAASTAQKYAAGIAHFAHWVRQCYLPLRLLDESTVEQFLKYHVPRCDCPAAMRVPDDLRAALGHLLDVLREQGVIAQLQPPGGHVAEELRRFDAHMRDVRGLAAGTRRGCLRIAQRLLRRRYGHGPVVIADLQPDDVRQFLSEELERRGTASNAAALGCALRGYLRYRGSCGDRVQGLLGVIAAPAHWNLASLPRALAPEEVERLLASFTAALPSPRRGYAMVRCALDMGLRSGEVASLALAGIDWRAGTVTLKRTKSRRQDVVPLPAVTGRALAEYVRHERPKTTNPALFVRRLAPHDQPIGADAVRRVIRDAYRRIGLTHGRSHALRHTLACRLLQHGSSLKEVADVLRHRSLNTSLIYAKLDNPRLAAVALPWPGSAP